MSLQADINELVAVASTDYTSSLEAHDNLLRLEQSVEAQIAQLIQDRNDMLEVLQRLYELRNLHMTRANAAGYRETKDRQWVADPISEAYNDAGKILKRIEGGT